MVVVERSGKPMAAVILVEMYQQVIAELEARFQVLDAIRARMPDVPEEEVQREVAEAIEAVRAARAKGRT